MPVSVVVLTFNEEENIRFTLESVAGFSDDIHVVDSLSTDRTVEIASEFDTTIHLNPWGGWAAQRNWAQEHIPIKYPWILYLDADEILTVEAKEEIVRLIHGAGSEISGFYLPFEFWFLDRKIGKGMVPHLRLVRHESVKWRAEGAREYNSAPKDSPTLKSRLIHRDNRGLVFWATSFIKKAEMESEFIYHNSVKDVNWLVLLRTSGMKNFMRTFLYRIAPPFLRIIPIFIYRLIFQTSWREGWPAIHYSILISLWYPILVDCLYLDKKWRRRSND